VKSLESREKTIVKTTVPMIEMFHPKKILKNASTTMKTTRWSNHLIISTSYYDRGAGQYPR
jgi:hypothetical protein